jgi:hypothetical protein
MVIYYYDDEKLINDVDVTSITLNNTMNILREHPILIGWTNQFKISAMHWYDIKKTNGNDLYIARFLYHNGTEAEVLQSYHVSEEKFIIDFNVKYLDIAIGKVFATSKGFTMYYYDNTRFLSVPWITRIEDHLPYRFTNEIRRMTYFSLRTESILIFNKFEATPTKAPEDIHFFVTMG